MGTKNQPSEFDCYRNAEPDEPMFILLARDVDAADRVREWVVKREMRKREEYKVSSRYELPENELHQLEEAEDCADAMEDWRKTNCE